MNKIEPVAVPADIVDALAAWLDRGALAPTATAIDIGGDLVDLVAVRNALTGHRSGDLSQPEMAVAVLAGTAAGYGSKRLGKLLGVTDRTVVRWRCRLGCKGAQRVRT